MGSIVGVGLLVLFAGLGGLAVLKNLGDRLFEAELPAPLGEAIASGQLEADTSYHVYVSAKNVPDRGNFSIRGSVRSSAGEEVER